MAKITIETENPGKISDGFHTFDELYAHRIILFICIMKMNKLISWKSKVHSDGEPVWKGWFVAGINLPSGQITYHIPENFWDLLDSIDTLAKAPDFDGHTSDDVIRRLNNWSMTL